MCITALNMVNWRGHHTASKVEKARKTWETQSHAYQYWLSTPVQSAKYCVIMKGTAKPVQCSRHCVTMIVSKTSTKLKPGEEGSGTADRRRTNLLNRSHDADAPLLEGLEGNGAPIQ